MGQGRRSCLCAEASASPQQADQSAGSSNRLFGATSRPGTSLHEKYSVPRSRSGLRIADVADLLVPREIVFYSQAGSFLRHSGLAQAGEIGGFD